MGNLSPSGNCPPCSCPPYQYCVSLGCVATQDGFWGFFQHGRTGQALGEDALPVRKHSDRLNKSALF
eukprot:1532875-Amphidinium_carterae.1